MTSDKVEWCSFAIWVDRVALRSSTLFFASGSTFDSVITEKLSSLHHFTNTLPWMFLVSFCRTGSGNFLCVHTWVGYQILPYLAQTVSPALTFCLPLCPRLCSHRCFPHPIAGHCCYHEPWRSLTSSLSSDPLPVPLTISSLVDPGFERQSSRTEFTLHASHNSSHLLNFCNSSASRSLLRVLSKLSNFSTIKKSNGLVRYLTSDLIILTTASSLRILMLGCLNIHVLMHFLQLNL